jgi:hypothetical protein
MRATNSTTAKPADARTADERPTFRYPRAVIAVTAPTLKLEHARPGVPDTALTREATALLQEFSITLLINHLIAFFSGPTANGRGLRF